MKWYGSTIFSLMLLAGVTSAVAVEPLGSGRTLTSSRRGYLQPAAIEQARQQPAPVERVGSETPVLYRQATWNIWAGTYNGYVYTPDACDYTPPCVDHLWDGYSQHPLRCEGWHGWWGCHGFGHCGHCGHCGHGCGCGQAIGCDSCVAKAPSCGVAMKPSCGAEPSCDCGGHAWHPGHHWNVFNDKCHHFWHHCKAHWSCACGTDIGCGCGIETKGEYSAPPPDSGQPPAPMPEVEEKKASAEEPSEPRAIRVLAIGTGLRGSYQE